MKKCKKCQGKGNVGTSTYTEHQIISTIDNGTCWECCGKGYIDTEAKATKDNMQEVFAVVWMYHRRKEELTLAKLKANIRTLTRVVIKDAVEQMEKLGLVKVQKVGRKTVIKGTKFGLDRWEKRIEKNKEKYKLELL